MKPALASIGDEGRRLEAEIERLNALVHQRRAEVGSEENLLSEARERHSEVELEHEKATQRIERFEDQIRSFEERKTALAAGAVRASPKNSPAIRASRANVLPAGRTRASRARTWSNPPRRMKSELSPV